MEIIFWVRAALILLAGLGVFLIVYYENVNKYGKVWTIKSPRPVTDKKTTTLLDYGIIQGTWRFVKSDDAGLPNEVRNFTDMLLVIEGESFKVIKDDVLVSSGELMRDGHFTVATAGKVFIFDNIFVSSMNGTKMAATYKDGNKDLFVELEKIPGDPVEDFKYLVDGDVQEIDIIRTNRKNVPIYSFTARLDKRCGQITGGYESYTVGGIDAEDISNAIMDIIWKYQLVGYEQVLKMPGKGCMKDCLKFYVRRSDGYSFLILQRGHIDKRLDACAKEIADLYDKYEYMRETPKDPSVNVEGIWKNEEQGIVFIFKNDHTYACIDRFMNRIKGHYATTGTKIVATDLIDCWDNIGALYRNKKIGNFSNLKMHDNQLIGYFDEMGSFEDSIVFKRC